MHAAADANTQLSASWLKRASLTLLWLLASLLLSSCKDHPEWKTFVTDEGGYSIDFPARVKTSQLMADSVHGPLEVSIATAEMSKMSFSVIYTDYPKEALLGADEVFDHALIGVAENLSGKVLSHFEEEKSGRPGRGYRLAFGRDRLARGAFYLDGARLYHLQLTEPNSSEDPLLSKRFFSSFRFLNQMKK